jgi:hypothetical protein
MSFRYLSLCATLLVALAGPAAAQTVKLEFVDGRVNLIAQNAPVRLVLAEWARLGGTRIVNADRVPGPPLTLELTGVPERQALDVVLRSVAGYIISARQLPGAGASAFDRVMILPTSVAPRPTSTATFAQPQPQPQFPQQPQVEDDDADDPTEVPVQVGVGRPRVVTPGQVNGPGMPGPARPVPQPFVPPLEQPMAQPAAQTPQPQQPSNPFAPSPGSSRPGEISPVPPQQNRPPNNQER